MREAEAEHGDLVFELAADTRAADAAVQVRARPDDPGVHEERRGDAAQLDRAQQRRVEVEQDGHPVLGGAEERARADGVAAIPAHALGVV